MAAITVRNLSDATHRALKSRARKHGRSTEAEVRAILDAAVTQDQVKFGTLLREIFQENPIDLVIERDRTITEPIDFS